MTHGATTVCRERMGKTRISLCKYKSLWKYIVYRFPRVSRKANLELLSLRCRLFTGKKGVPRRDGGVAQASPLQLEEPLSLLELIRKWQSHGPLWSCFSSKDMGDTAARSPRISCTLPCTVRTKQKQKVTRSGLRKDTSSLCFSFLPRPAKAQTHMAHDS